MLGQAPCIPYRVSLVTLSTFPALAPLYRTWRSARHMYGNTLKSFLSLLSFGFWLRMVGKRRFSFPRGLDGTNRFLGLRCLPLP